MIGKTISQYEVLEQIGEGGMGSVYKARDTKLKRLVALKFLSTDQTASDEQKKRFIREARAASNLDHSNIGTIYQIDETEQGELFIAMAYYAGDTLKDRMAEGPLSVEFAVRVAQQMAQGLTKAHAKGIVHRDIKPANILFTEEDEVKIVDFGLAKLADQSLLTKTGTTMGTVLYMSPEHVQGQPVDQRTDIWALGVILYEMLTGTHPFAGDYEHAVMYSIVNEEPEPVLDVPAGLAAIIERALAKKQEERYQSMDELQADLKTVDDELGTSKAAPAAFRSRVRRRKLKRLLRPFAVVAVAIVVALVYFWPNPDLEADQVSIAVLPLRVLGETLEDEWFQDVMTEELITEFTKIGGWRVISRTSTMHYKTNPKPVPEIAEELKVDFVVDGAILQLGGQIKVSATLIDAPKNENVWAANYQREYTNILRLQAEISQTIAHQVKVELAPEEEIRLASVRQVVPEAQDAYLKGRYHWGQRTNQGMLNAVNYFQQAIALDSTYAAAHAGLAQTYALMGGYMEEPPKDLAQKAIAVARTAITLDSTLAEGHMALGFAIMLQQLQRSEKDLERSFLKAIALNPSYADAYRYYGWYLMSDQRLRESWEMLKRAESMSPVDPAIKTELGWVLLFERKYDEAIEQYRQALELDPSFALAYSNLGEAYEYKGEFDLALQAAEKAIELGGRASGYLAGIGMIYASRGQEDEALEILAELTDLANQGFEVSAWHFVPIYIRLGEKDMALDWIEEAYEKKDPTLWQNNLHPMYDELRDERRFQEVMRKVELERGR